MPHAELMLIAQEYHIPPSAVDKISAWVSRTVIASTQRLRDALRTDATRSEIEATIVGVIEDVAHPHVTPSLEQTVVDARQAVEGQESHASTSIDIRVANTERHMQPTQHGTAYAYHKQAHVEPRYEDLGRLGVGGMGDVRRVRDRALNRTLAMKIIKPQLMKEPSAVARFIEEAQVGAQLQHPSMIPVHDMGQMPDGRHFFTMQEIRGRGLDDAINSVHGVSKQGWQYDAHGWSLRQLVTALQKTCQAVGYAHARGVIHRDLKPSNIMVGRAGEVFVVDWGIAKIKGSLTSADDVEDQEMATVETDRSREASHSTRIGAITGTPAYMSPEQAEGKLESLSPRSDVYALGVILYNVLTGRVPYQGRTIWQVLMAIVRAEREMPSQVAKNHIPEELEEICERAMSVKPEDRYLDAREMADDLGAWLDGAKRREKALELVAAARKARIEGEEMLRRAKVLRVDGEALLEDVATWAPEEEKHKGWALNDEATALERNARLKSLEVTQTLHAALTHVPELPEAHEMLAVHHREQHQQAEAERDQDRAKGEEILLRTHVASLPEHAVRRELAAYLQGTGAVTLVTDPPGAEVRLYRFVTRHRRLVPELVQSIGHSPLITLPLEMGSYLLELHKDDQAVVRYPVFIERGQHWDGVRPGGSEPYPIMLPKQGALGSDECYVPAGWFWAGGDPDAYNAWPRRRYWIDALVMQKCPVTNRQFLTFLNDLVARGHEEEALQHVPRERSSTIGERGAMIYGRDAQGQFILRPDADGDMWLDAEPVSMIEWYGAKAYAAWQASRDGKRWRLAMEQEWEKVARGVDARLYPWGDVLDPSWCCMKDSHPGQPNHALIDDFPTDVSPYGVRGLGGNTRDWCEDIYSADAPVSSRVPSPVKLDAERVRQTHGGRPRVFRGGAWSSTALYCRAAARTAGVPTHRRAGIGVRLCRSYSSENPG